MRRPILYQPGGSRSPRDAGHPHKLFDDDNDHLWYTTLDPDAAASWLLGSTASSVATIVAGIELTSMVWHEIVDQLHDPAVEPVTIAFNSRAAKPYGLVSGRGLEPLVGDCGWLGMRLVASGSRLARVLVAGRTSRCLRLDTAVSETILQLPGRAIGRQSLLRSMQQPIDHDLDNLFQALPAGCSGSSSPTVYIRWKLDQ